MKTNAQKEKILTASKERMIKFGYRKVTMDEIAHDLTMSKNTIYKIFQSKVDIANELFVRLEKEINLGLLRIQENNKDFSEIISKSIFFLQQSLSPWFEHFLGDIKLEVPELWSQFVNFRNEKISEIKDLVDSGIRKKKFRKINSTLAVRIYMGAVDHVLNPDFLEKEKISFSKAIEDIFDIWSNGILNK